MSNEQNSNPNHSFIPSKEVNEEMTDNATALVKNNYEIFRIFLYRGLPHQEEPYNNVPEDGLYEVKDDTYKSMSDIENLVKATFVDSEAERILTDVNGAGAVFSEKTTDDDRKVIGLNADLVDSRNRFKGIEYSYSWENARFELAPKSNTECEILIHLSAIAGADTSDIQSAASSGSEADTSSADGNEKTLTAVMNKVNGSWRLMKLVY